MAFMDVTDPQTRDGGDWWAQNAPSDLGGVQPWSETPPEFNPQPAPQALPQQSDNWDAGRVAQYFASRGVTPNSTSADYWAGKWNEWGKNDPAYFMSRLSTADEFNPGGQPAAAPLSGMAMQPSGVPMQPLAPAPTPTTFQASASVPAYTPYNPGPAPTPIAFTAPTAEQARNTPGYQFEVDEANRGAQRSAVARTGALGGGTLRELAALNTGLADQNYGNIWNQAFTANQAANQNALNAYQATTGANLGAGQLNLSGTNQQFQNTLGPEWNAYLSNIGQQQFGANYGLNANQQMFGQGLANNQNMYSQFDTNRRFDLGAQNQSWNQGFAENQNAYSQYDNSQKTAFDQWYKLTQAGNPGNPYT